MLPGFPSNKVMFMKSKLVLFVVLTLFFAGCTGGKSQGTSNYQKFSYEFTGPFDTAIQFIGYFRDHEEFESLAQKGQARFEELHRLFDKYNSYPGLNNIKTINDNAGLAPVEVSQEIIDLISFSKEWHQITPGVVNIALGPVLEIWHDYRERGKSDPGQAAIPPQEELERAAAFTNLSKVLVDDEKNTVFLAEKNMSLDVGAVAKGFAAEIVARELQKAGMNSALINTGGNVRLIGTPLDGLRSKWGIGIQNPDGNVLIPDDKPLDTIFAADTSIVTSGDYQRFYVVDGEMYHHLIDPRTLMPARYYRAVTVMTKDGGVADFMSSTVFLLPYEESRALVESIEGLEALWVFPDGKLEATEGMKKSLQILGGAVAK